MTEFVVEFHSKVDGYVYRKLSLIEAEDSKAAAKIVADRLAAEKRFEYRLYSCKPIKKAK